MDKKYKKCYCSQSPFNNRWSAQFGRMAFVMKKNVTLCPIGLGFPLAKGLMLEAYSVANLVEKLFWF
jgi:hypothetical protein